MDYMKLAKKMKLDMLGKAAIQKKDLENIKMIKE